MDEAQRAQQLVGDWVNAHVVPRLLEYLAGYSFATVTVAGMFGTVQIGRNPSGAVYISYLNLPVRQAIQRALDENYLLTDGAKVGKKFILRVTPRA